MTLEGWYCLHDFRSIDWPAWKELSAEARRKAVDELLSLLASYEQTERENNGSTVFYSIVGQKADFVFMHLRPTMEELNDLETAFNKTTFADFTVPAHSFVSVVELSNYVRKLGENPDTDPQIQAKLKPILPKNKHFCFYPMDKRRTDQNNWYMLSMEERRELMKEHGTIGKKYAGRVKQIITGAIGFDDWEWGVTLLSDEPLVFKRIVYEMRFDEASARYGEFGGFHVGNLLDKEKVQKMLEV